MSKAKLISAFATGVIFAYAFLPHPVPGEYPKACDTRSERDLSPHEQQPDPIPAVTQGWIDVERWIL